MTKTEYRCMDGENPHQKAKLIIDERVPACSIFAAEILGGPELSYNDLVDCDSALALMREFKDEQGAVNLMFHHGNPCGLTVNPDTEKGFCHVLEVSDDTSIIEGIYVCSKTVTESMANHIVKNCYLHAVIARDFEESAVKLLKTHEQLTICKLNSMFEDIPDCAKEVRQLIGGKLVQDYNTALINKIEFITSRHASEEEMKQLLIAWKVVKHTKTNAIVLVKDNATVAIAPGLNNRIWSVKHALERAKDSAEGSVMASDAIIPLCESVEIAGKAGITAIIEPGGWFKENENIAVAEQYGIAMVTTGVNQFKH